MPTSHELTTLEQAAFLLRHPVVAARVALFQEAVNTVGYDQSPQPPGGWDIWNQDLLDYWLRQIPGWIPSWGIAVADTPYWPYVVIFPDAVGVLRYTGTDAAQAVHIGDPPPAGIPDTSPIDWITLAVVAGALLYAGLYFKK